MSQRLRVRVEDVIKRLKKEGWYVVEQEGSHKQYKHPVKTGRVTVAGDGGEVVNPKTFKSICKQAGWKGWKR